MTINVQNCDEEDELQLKCVLKCRTFKRLLNNWLISKTQGVRVAFCTNCYYPIFVTGFDGNRVVNTSNAGNLTTTAALLLFQISPQLKTQWRH